MITKWISHLSQYKAIIAITITISLIGLSIYFGSGSILGVSRQINAGSYKLQAEPVTFVNSHYRMTFTADTNGQDVNAVGLYLKFDPEIMRIINMDTTKSFCQFYPENKFDNTNGTVSIACGAPNPGFSGTSDIAIIDFYINNIGKAKVEILPKSQLLLNDGKGTNIFNEAITHELTILNNI